MSSERADSVPIVKTIQRIAPKSGQALELASGTGQHIVKQNREASKAFPEILRENSWKVPGHFQDISRTILDRWHTPYSSP